MIRINRSLSKLILLAAGLAFLLALGRPAEQVSAQEIWPPFWFELSPLSEAERITYEVRLYSRVDWQLPDLTVKIPLPEGARFLEAGTQPGVAVDFDGREVTFTTSNFNQYGPGNWFSVAVTEPDRTVFTTRAWISWKGEHGGDYLTDPIAIDITRRPLTWTAPPRSRLQLGLEAVTTGDLITYALYPKTVDRRRTWDVEIKLPLPRGTAFLAAEAPAPFTADFDGREVSFFALELERQVEAGPLIVRTTTTDTTTLAATTRPWIAWMNVIYFWERLAPPPAQEQMTLAEIAVPRHPAQAVVFDMPGDAPLANYDVVSLAFQEHGPLLTVVFNTAGDIGPVGQPLQFTLYIDSDCNPETGQPKKHWGAEYRLSYYHEDGRALFISWDAAQEAWRWSQVTNLETLVEGTSLMMTIPRDLIGAGQRLCWIGWTANDTEAFQQKPPPDWIPNETFLELTTYEFMTAGTGLDGQLAVPVANGRDFYDTYIFSIPAGRELARLPNTRQPHFRTGGRKLLANRQSNPATNLYEHDFLDGRTITYDFKNYSAAESIYEYDLATETGRQISSAPTDSHPSADPQGQEVIYGNSETGRLVLSGRSSPVKGTHPVWAGDDLIAYQGCTQEAETAACGLYLVEAQALAAGQPAAPRRLTAEAGDIPTAAQGDLLAFTSQRDGDPEAYVIDLEGTGLKNLSHSPSSNDGLPTFSPDGRWVAFVSDRSGRWAVWLVPVTGGPAHKLFDLPGDSPWGAGDRAWLDERISWGPSSGREQGAVNREQ